MKNFLIILFAFFTFIQISSAQWWKDTVWTRDTYVNGGFYMLKFSKNDSIIVGHGLQKDFFYDATTGKDLGWIWGYNEVHFFNNDLNFIRLSQNRTTLEIWDTKSFTVIDSLESDGTIIGSIDISTNEQLVSGVTQNGVRSWDLNTKRILNSRMPNIQPNNGKFKLDNVLFQNAKFLLNNNQFLIGCVLTYKDTTIQNGSTYQKSYNILVNAFTLDGIDIFDKIGGIDFRLSNTNQYIAFHTVDMYNGLEVYDFNTKQLLWKIPVNGPSLTGLEFSPDDKYLVTASSNNSFGMTIWDMTTGKEHFHYISGATYSNIDVSNDGKYITYSIGDGLRLIRTHFDGVSVNESDNTVLTLYPNPTNNSITLTFELKLPCQLNYSIFNEKGQLIKSLLDEFTNPGTISQSFDVTNLPTGTYFLKISGADFGLTFKVMIMR